MDGSVKPMPAKAVRLTQHVSTFLAPLQGVGNQNGVGHGFVGNEALPD
jgi:hypothetical protein